MNAKLAVEKQTKKFICVRKKRIKKEKKKVSRKKFDEKSFVCLTKKKTKTENQKIYENFVA